MVNKDTVSNHVAIHRKTAGVTQEELAKAVCVTRQTIISIEKGNYLPSILLALKIAIYFKLPVEKVFIYEEC
jgi:putative transcriptional regulator